MRGAGCTYNDMVDRTFDQQVQRTALRPLAAGHLNYTQASIFLGLQLILALVVLLQFPWHTIQWGFASVLLVVLYPWMKRLTYWPQAFLGLTFNWGIFLGWSLYQPAFKMAPFLLYLAGIGWTLGYDTIYAHQDREDDLKAGVKSSALALGPRTSIFLALNYTFVMVLLSSIGWLEGLSLAYYGGLILVGLHLTWQVSTLDVSDPQDCHRKFKANRMTGLLILGSFIASWCQKLQ